MLTLEPIEKRGGLTRDIFLKEHLKPLKPVVFTDLMNNWPAKTEWTIENLKRKYGHFNVPVVTPNYSKPGKGYMEPELHMRFDDYLTLMERGKMSYRIFLWNIFRQAPEMVNDFTLPTIMDGFLRDFPYMFFGGEGSITPMHFDLDLSHVFLNQLHGRKRVVLFSHEDSKNLYHHPYTVASYVDINKPDYERFPALSSVKGWETVLNPGETVFIPTGFWHYIEYVDGGYSIALRANESYTRRVKGAYQIAKHFVVDKSMNKILGSKWRTMKEKMAKRRAEEVA